MLLIQYVGFEAKAVRREYSYRIVDPRSGERTVVLTIANEAFLARRVRYQDAPEICYRKLQRELEAETTEHPMAKRFAVSDTDLSEYQAAHRPARR